MSPLPPRRGERRWQPGDAREGLRALLNALPAMIGYWDRELRNRMANDAYLEYFGADPEAMAGMHIREVLGEALYASNLPYIHAVLAGEEQLFDRDITTPSGELRHTQASYIPDVRADGQVVGFFVLVTDVTARRRAELAQEEAEHRYRALVEHLPRAAVTLVSPDLRLRWVGGSALGDLDEAALLGRPVAETAGGGAHGAHIAALYARALAGESVSEEIHSVVTGRDFSLDIAPLPGPDGTVSAALGVAQDITERVREQAALRLQSQITAHMGEGALLMRAGDLVIVHANARTEAMFGYDAGELEGRPVSILNARTGERGPEETAAAVAAAVVAEDGTWAGELFSVRKDGTTFWRRSSISRFEHPEHGTLLVSVVRDVTERREREAEEKALARIATLVAHAAAPEVIFAAVADEARTVLDAYTAGVTRFVAAGRTGEVLAGVTRDGEDLTGTAVDLDGPSAAAQVFRTGGLPARYDGPGWAFPARQPDARRPPVSGSVATPIRVRGELWGAISALFTDGPVPANAAVRLERFGRLVELAIANAEAWQSLARQAATDPLTGLANHRTFHERLSAETERARRGRAPLSLAVLDLDHFKTVNDRFGHHVGDRVLVEYAERLLHHAADGELVARIGGEEFAWIMPGAGRAAAVAAAERVRLAIAGEPFPHAGRLTVSAGVCVLERDMRPEQAVQCADRALYRAKARGRNATVACDEQV